MLRKPSNRASDRLNLHGNTHQRGRNTFEELGKTSQTKKCADPLLGTETDDAPVRQLRDAESHSSSDRPTPQDPDS